MRNNNEGLLAILHVLDLQLDCLYEHPVRLFQDIPGAIPSTKTKYFDDRTYKL